MKYLTQLMEMFKSKPADAAAVTTADPPPTAPAPTPDDTPAAPVSDRH